MHLLQKYSKQLQHKIGVSISRLQPSQILSIVDILRFALRLGLFSGLLETTGIDSYLGDNCVGLGQYVSDAGKINGDNGGE